MENRGWNVFLELLRAGLWEQDLRLPDVPDVAGWEQLMQMAGGTPSKPEQQKPAQQTKTGRN